MDRREEADTAHVIGLFTEGKPLAADVLVGIWEGVGDLAESYALSAKSGGINLDVIFLGFSAETRDVDHARNAAKLPLKDPVLGSLEVSDRVTLAADDVSVHLADRVPG